MRLSISEILDRVSRASSKQEKIDMLRQYDSFALRTVLKGALDPNIEWLLPEGEPPYKSNSLVGQETMLYVEAKKMYLFVKGGNDNLKQLRREALFIQMLETIDPKDAKLLCAMKDKKIPYKGITRNMVSEAFPGLIEIERADEQVEA